LLVFIIQVEKHLIKNPPDHALHGSGSGAIALMKWKKTKNMLKKAFFRGFLLNKVFYHI